MGTSTSGPIDSTKSGRNKGKAPVHEWIQKGRPLHKAATHNPPTTNTLVIYTAPNVPTNNSFDTLNTMPEGLGHEDMQEDLLARAYMDKNTPYTIDSPRESLDSSHFQDNPDLDGATASESEGEQIENLTNDPIPLDEAQPARKRG